MGMSSEELKNPVLTKSYGNPRKGRDPGRTTFFGPGQAGLVSMPSSRNWTSSTPPGVCSHQADRPVCLGKGDDFPNRILSGKHGDKAIKSEGDTPMGRGSVFQGIEQEAEFGPCFFPAQGQQFENFRLKIPLENAHASPCDLGAVENQVVCTSSSFQRIAGKEGDILFQR